MILAKFLLFFDIPLTRSVLVVFISFGGSEALARCGLLIGVMHIRYNYALVVIFNVIY